MNYDDRIIAFIDILGFREKINSTISRDNLTDIPDKIQTIYSILQIIKDSFQRGGDDNPYLSSQEVSYFSDSIVISFKTEERNFVFYMLNGILHLSMDLISKGFLLRGGISRGKLIHNKDLIFGPALVNAYDTESKASLYPRIILDESLIETAKIYHGHQNSPDEEEEYIKRIVKVDSDSMYYVDYFGAAYGEMDDPYYSFPGYLGNIFDIITDGLKSNKPDILVKYGWMKQKYNNMVGLAQKDSFQNSLIEEGHSDAADLFRTLKKF